MELLQQIEIEKYKRKLKDEFLKLSARERWLAFGAVVAVLFLVVWQSYEKVGALFASQQVEMLNAQQDLNEIKERLQRFGSLQAKRKAIEEQYKEVEIKEGVRSHLEALLKDKAGVTSGYIIKDMPVVQFGGNYEQAPFSVKFTIASLPGLVDFLKELVHGPRPLVLTELEVKKEPIGDKLRVSVDVSSIRRVQ